MKQILLLKAAAACAAVIIGCIGCTRKAAGSLKVQDTSAAADLLKTVQERGEVIIAMEGTWAPWTYHDEKNELTGFDVEVAKLIAAKLGVRAAFAEGEWSGLFAGLDSKRYDIIVNGVEVTPERSEKYDFSDPYAYIHTALIVRTDNTAVKSFEDLKGKKTANSISSTYMTLAEKYGATASGVETLDQTFDLVLSKRVDATLNAEVSYYDYMHVHPDAALKVAALTPDASNVCIPMRKGYETASFRKAVNKAISDIRASGELAAVSQKYFGRDITSVK